MTPRAAVVDWARAIYEDLDLAHVEAWLAEEPGRKAAGYLPVYAPREVIAASGMLPVGIHGGGDRIEIIRGDAYYQSYICHLPRSVVELALSGRLDALSAVVFPSTCDVIRNLSGMWKLMKPDVYVRYIDIPQNRDPEIGGQFWAGELRTLMQDLCEVSGRDAGAAELRDAIHAYNDARALLRTLYAKRREAPWSVPTEELYLIQRAGEVVDVYLWMAQVERYLAAIEADPGRPRDNCRVIVVGAFCEQPPLGLIKTIERAGCYIVDDDFLLGNRMITRNVPTSGDPIEALAQSFVATACPSSILYEPDPDAKRALMRQRVTAAGADGIIFAAASFCDPALLDRPMLRAGAEADAIPCIAFKFSENTGQFQQFREQAGTFADSIKLWGGT